MDLPASSPVVLGEEFTSTFLSPGLHSLSMHGHMAIDADDADQMGEASYVDLTHTNN